MLFNTLAAISIGTTLAITTPVGSISTEKNESIASVSLGLLGGLMTDAAIVVDADFLDSTICLDGTIYTKSAKDIKLNIGHSFDTRIGTIRLGASYHYNELIGKKYISEQLQYAALELDYDNNRFFNFKMCGGWNFYTVCRYETELHDSITDTNYTYTFKKDFSDSTIISVEPEFYYRLKGSLKGSRVYIGFGIINWQYLPDGKTTFSPIRIRYSWCGGFDFKPITVNHLTLQPYCGFDYFCEHEVVPNLVKVQSEYSTPQDKAYLLINTGCARVYCGMKMSF